jgi:hypothetical protein
MWVQGAVPSTVQGSHSGCVPPLAGVKCNNGYSTLLTDLQDGIYRMGYTGWDIQDGIYRLGYTGSDIQDRNWTGHNSTCRDLPAETKFIDT